MSQNDSSFPLFSSLRPTSLHNYSHPPQHMAPTTSYLARSASLGRKKDPFAYREGDVESGLGTADKLDSPGPLSPGGGHNWTGNGYSGGQRRDSIIVSPTRASYQLPVVNNNSGMNPPSLPAHIINRHPAAPEHPPASAYNPYVPAAKNADSGPSSNSSHLHNSTGGQWTEHRRPSGAQMPLSSSYVSQRGSETLSPYVPPLPLDPQATGSGQGSISGPSPRHSPLLNPYASASPVHPAWGTASPNIPPSQINPLPLAQQQSQVAAPSSPKTHWTSSAGGGHIRPQASPVGGRPPPTRPSAITTPAGNIYPASQPVTPAGKYDPSMPPPTIIPTRNGADSGDSSRSGSGSDVGREGLREVRGWKDLKAIINTQPNGRRADPDQPGKYLSSLKCLTTSLPQTYTLCNPSFRYVTSDNPRRVLTKPSKPVHNDGADNEDWDYILYVNDVLGGEDGGDRYLILDVLGQGTFGQVVKCQNMRTHELVAVKVVKNKPAYLQQSKMEVAILELLNTQHDPQDHHHILRLLNSFTHKHHLCLVFECLSSNLYELIKQNQFKGLSTQLVKVFTQQLLDCLGVLKEARLIHCDLKPENILLKSLQSPQIKVIDFGSACHEMQTVYTYIQSRFYRSPEVLLGLPYSTSIDMWSLGCIVVELFLGLPLFPGTSEYNQVTRIVDMLGNPPNHLLEVGKQTHEFFNSSTDAYGRKTYKLKSLQQYSLEHHTDEQPSKQYFKQTKLKDIIMEYPVAKRSKGGDVEKEMTTRRAFVDFAEGLLNMDPIQRWSPQQAMKHPFITGEKWIAPWQPDAATNTTSSRPVSPADIPTSATSSGSASSKKYGGLVQSPPTSRTQRVYSDAAAYNQQLVPHQTFVAQQTTQAQAQAPSQTQAQTQRHVPFSPGYDMGQAVAPSIGGGYGHHRVVSQQLPSIHQHQQRQSGQWGMPPPSGYQQRFPSLNSSTSHANLRPHPHNSVNVPIIANPPPNSYYPSSRSRANTINQMNTIPPALARLVHFGAQDPNGSRNSLTPVLNRDDAIKEWERRQQGHQRQSSMQNTAYPQLEYLQEQAELASMQGQNWMVPGPYASQHTQGAHGGHHVHTQTHGGHGHHRQNPSGQYHMQPHIGISPPNASDYRPRPTSEYEPPISSSSSSSQNYGLPTYPPLAATTSSNPNSATNQVFDPFDGRDGGMGMMYTPLQPNQAYGYQGGGGGHSAKSSYSAPYNSGNPFVNQTNSSRY
ncbi:hypothetical protein L204_100109 [Cryptococcus depauperatus]|nr:CMGC/DYRK/YAK protein kinase [Cryptococcus depauperatus CBS 7855]